MVRGLEELRLVELAPEDGVLAEVDGLVAQRHRLDALAHMGPVQAPRVEQRVASRDIPVPPLRQAGQLREVLVPGQERQADREGVVALQHGLDALGDLVTRGVGPEEEVPAVDVGAHVPVALGGDLLAQLTHDDLVLASDVDAAQQRHVLHADPLLLPAARLSGAPLRPAAPVRDGDDESAPAYIQGPGAPVRPGRGAIGSRQPRNPRRRGGRPEPVQ